jgi:hypothetical protein
MPKKTITAPLRGFVRSEIAKAFEENGFARPREIARMVVTAHPEDVELAGKSCGRRHQDMAVPNSRIRPASMA